MVRASTLPAPSQELAARAQPMSRPFSFLLFFSFDFAFRQRFMPSPAFLSRGFRAASQREAARFLQQE